MLFMSDVETDRAIDQYKYVLRSSPDLYLMSSLRLVDDDDLLLICVLGVYLDIRANMARLPAGFDAGNRPKIIRVHDNWQVVGVVIRL